MRNRRRPRKLLATLALMGSPLAAQVDLSGQWSIVPAQDAVGNHLIGDYAGLPLNAEAIRRAAMWDPAIRALPEWQCRPQSGASIKQGPSSLRAVVEIDPLSRRAVALNAEWPGAPATPIYLDGRAHPPEHAAHTWTGFSTGVFEGDRLKVTTTHLKEGMYRDNGVPQSDRATLTEYLIRRRFRNEDYLTWVVIAHDSVYLSEPLARSSEYRLDIHQRSTAEPCAITTEVGQPVDGVPYRLPDANPQINDFADQYGLPRGVHADGAQTMYPEYRARLATLAGRPAGR